MQTLYLKALGLGIAGFDPSGALIAMAFLTAGAARRAVFLFCLVYLVATIALLTIASSALSTRMPGTGWRPLDNHPQTKAVAELLIGAGLLAFAAWRLLHHGGQGTKGKTRDLPVSTWATVGAGVLLAVGVIGDPALIAFTVVAATADTLTDIIVAQTIAVLTSKVLVLVVMVAIGLGVDKQVSGRLRAWWTKAAPAMTRIISVVLIGMAAALITNALWWFQTGGFLL